MTPPAKGRAPPQGGWGAVRANFPIRRAHAHAHPEPTMTLTDEWREPPSPAPLRGGPEGGFPTPTARRPRGTHTCPAERAGHLFRYSNLKPKEAAVWRQCTLELERFGVWQVLVNVSETGTCLILLIVLRELYYQSQCTDKESKPGRNVHRTAAVRSRAEIFSYGSFIFKALTEFVPILLLFHALVFESWGMRDLRSPPTREETHLHCAGR